MIDFKVEEAGNEKVLKINGELTIEYAAQFQDILADTLEETGFLLLDLEDVTAADLSCLQLICSAHRSAEKSEKRFSLSGSFPATFMEAAKDAGYLCDTGCGLNYDKGCIWPMNGNDEQ